MLEKFFDLLKDEKSVLPNRFTRALGERIHAARTASHMTQSDLAERAYFKQSSISKIESGDKAVTAEEILYLCYALDKPILYFFPEEVTLEVNKDQLSILEKELLIQARRLDQKDLRKLVAQAKALADFD
jgi:transcriptional regulator with XRE-family HTH domain